MRRALTWIELKLWDYAIPTMSNSERAQKWLQKSYRALGILARMPRLLAWAVLGLIAGATLGVLILRLL